MVGVNPFAVVLALDAECAWLVTELDEIGFLLGRLSRKRFGWLGFLVSTESDFWLRKMEMSLVSEPGVLFMDGREGAVRHHFESITSEVCEAVATNGRIQRGDFVEPLLDGGAGGAGVRIPGDGAGSGVRVLSQTVKQEEVLDCEPNEVRVYALSERALELGVDISAMNVIYLRNMPPTPSVPNTDGALRSWRPRRDSNSRPPD